MSTVLPFSNNTISVFAYEGFDYTISNPILSLTLQTVSNTGGLEPSSLYFTKNGNNSYRFSVAGVSNNLTPGTRESFTLELNDTSGNVALTSSNTVSIGGGRLLDASGISLSNTSYTFYRNEPVSQTLGRPLRLVAPSFALNTPTSIPALPPGLTFVRVDSNIFDISGIPLVVVPNSNYQVIGIQSNGSKIVTTRLNMIVSNDRLQVNLSGSSIIAGMQIGSEITPRVLTAIPPLGSSNVRYAFPTLPDGIVVTDICGNIQPSPFFPSSDPSYTMIIAGAPTSNAANLFRSLDPGGSGVQYNVQASVGLLSNTQGFSFKFGETVLFDTPTLSNNFVGIPVDPSLNFFYAKTYFTSSVPISNIFSPDLRSDLSLTFVPSLSRANLTGTPSNATSASYTIKAINSNGISAEITPTITILNDTVSFSSPVGVDLCYNFILSRPLTQPKDGYYTSNIRFTATAASGRPVSLSAPELVGTGLSLDSSGVVVGIPSTVKSLTNLNVAATVAGSPATATKTVKFAILNDVFTFADVSASAFTFIQNIASVPFQIPVTTLSGRNVINYSQSGFPTGLTVGPTGVVSGTPSVSTPTSGVVAITATTGYASGSSNFNYTLIPDSMLFIVNPSQYSYIAGDPVGTIDVDAVTYSGTTVSNFDLSISPTYGLTFNSSTAVLSGTWTTGIPPSTLLPSSCNFSITGQAGGLVGALPMNFTASPTLSNAMLFIAFGLPTGGSNSSWMYSTRSEDISSFTQISSGFSESAFSQIAVKNNDPNNNVILALTTGELNGATSFIYKGTRLNNIVGTALDPLGTYYPNMSSLINIPGTSTWYMAGTMGLIEGIDANPTTQTVFVKSEDDGSTWDFANAKVFGSAFPNRLFSRDLNAGYNAGLYGKQHDSYLRGGVAMAYSGNVWIAGGAFSSNNLVMVYSTDLGENWSNVTGGFTEECASINVDNSGLWVATGSSGYTTHSVAVAGGGGVPYNGPTSTIKYSFDQGQTWEDATDGFAMFGYELIYANGIWMASGTNAVPSEDVSGETYFIPEVRYSTNGINWIKTDFTASLFDPSNVSQSNAIAPLRVGSMNFDGTFWNVFVNEQTPVDRQVRLYRHDAVSDLDTDWFAVDISGSTNDLPLLDSNARFLSLTSPRYLYTGQPPTNIQLSFSASSVGGPVFTSPPSSSFLQYQYMQIVPIQLSATGTGQVYFFIETATLPAGLVYNRITNQITGKSVQLGQVSTRVYAKDDIGTSSFVISFTTVVPRIIRKQDGAGAYTSLLRQYTEVLGAQNARDNRALPSQERALGEFMSPEGPDVITQIIDPKCCKPNS